MDKYTSTHGFTLHIKTQGGHTVLIPAACVAGAVSYGGATKLVLADSAGYIFVQESADEINKTLRRIAAKAG